MENIGRCRGGIDGMMELRLCFGQASDGELLFIRHMRVKFIIICDVKQLKNKSKTSVSLMWQTVRIDITHRVGTRIGQENGASEGKIHSTKAP